MSKNIEIPPITYIILALGFAWVARSIYKDFTQQWKSMKYISVVKSLINSIISFKIKLYLKILLILTLCLSIYDNFLDNLIYKEKNITTEMDNIYYLFPVVIAFISYLIFSVSYYLKIKELTQKHIDELISGIEVIEINNKFITIISDKQVLNDSHSKQLELAIKKNISSIRQDPNILNKFYLYIGKNDYRQLETGSIARIEKILRNKKDKPQFISTQENDSEISHKFSSILPIKRIIRDLENIEHQTGLNKNTLTIISRDGFLFFNIKKTNNKIYLLDDIIPNIKKQTKKELPFVLGVNESSGNVITECLTKLKHLLIAGKTGSGKSCTFKGIIESLMYFNSNIVWYMLDFADSALVRYESFNNVKYVESELDDINKALNEILKEYQYRKQLLRENHFENIQEYNNKFGSQLPYLIFAIDEANAFRSEMDTKEFAPIEKKIKTLLQRGRKYGIFCIMAVQQTNDRDFVKSWKTQFTRISHLLEDTADVSNVTTKKEYQQLIPNLRTGEFYVLSETEEYKLKGCFTDNKHNKLYNILKEGYIKNETIIEVEEKTQEITA